MAITFAELKEQARDRADMSHSEFVTDSELSYYINSSIAELHDLLVQSYNADYSVKNVTFQTSPTQTTYSLSTVITDNDFYKLRAVDAQLNGDEYISLKPFNFNERNRFQNSGSSTFLGTTNIRYRIVGNDIIFSPQPDGNIQIQLWYVPLATKLVLDTDELDDLNQYYEYVIVDAAIKMLNKEESDVSVLFAQKQALKQRIEEAAQNRDVGEPESISDVYVENDDYLYGKSRS